MSACHCYHLDNRLVCPDSNEAKPARRGNLFNWVTVMLVSMWVGIVAVAAEMAGSENLTAVPNLDAFLRTLF